jgi:Protein of unknown function (DUF3179)
VGGRRLTFHLAGINNQNFLMRDDQTGSYWQQISGRAISGPLGGAQLSLVFSDELTFAVWKTEQPGGTVLLPVSRYASEYEVKDWDARMARRPVVTYFPGSGMNPRELILGIRLESGSRAFPYRRVIEERLVKDRVDTAPVLLVVGPDGESVRAFRDRISGLDGEPDFYRLATASGALMIDASSGSEWNFQGCAVSGSRKGECLQQVPIAQGVLVRLAELQSEDHYLGQGRQQDPLGSFQQYPGGARRPDGTQITARS